MGCRITGHGCCEVQQLDYARNVVARHGFQNSDEGEQGDTPLNERMRPSQLADVAAHYQRPRYLCPICEKLCPVADCEVFGVSSSYTDHLTCRCMA